MELSRRQRAALDAICDTFAPGLDGLPSATELGVPAFVIEAIARHPRVGERERVLRLLSVWQFAARPLRRFSRLPLAQREAVLRSWRDSRLAARRSAYKTFRKAVLSHYFGAPGKAREALGYPGPLEVAVEPLPFEPERAQGELACDVCVVGSGAGGGTAAAVLAAAGLHVVVLEAGEPLTFTGEEHDALERLYLEAAASATEDQSLDFLAGWCIGGGTTVNWTTSLRTPDDVREEWATHGVPAFASDEFSGSLDAVWERMGVNYEHGTASPRDAVLERGAQALGWHVEAQGRNVRGCDQDGICGYCCFGCALGAKQDVTRTWLADAVEAGAHVLAGVRVERVLVERGAAVGVEGGGVRVRSRAVVVACGAFHTPALLRRSGLVNANIGRHLRFHPVTLIAGEFEEEIRPWEGALQARYSEEHARLDGGYGVRYETAPIHPTFLGAGLQWDGARESLDLARRYRNLAPIFPLVRDRDAGEVVVDRNGEPSARYRLSRYDLRHMRAGFVGAARILEAAGAKRIVSSHAKPLIWEPGGNGGVGRFLADADARGWEPNRVLYASAHIMGTARMAGSPAIGGCDPRGETWEVARLVVCDGSTFPTASGVNPMISIAAVAHMNASALAARLA
ncbi:MAG TPA: FAD-dependent oxidoreductase [Gaiellaceae bacterium]|jgi:choline dehydrogenase-like flavoprotein|nr:FAD-dependent oxidoreductase [Gaiellaceae bacterium]